MSSKKLNKQRDWNKTFELNGHKYTVNFDFLAQGRQVTDVMVNQVFDLTAYEEVTNPAIVLHATNVANAAADDIANNHYEL